VKANKDQPLPFQPQLKVIIKINQKLFLENTIERKKIKSSNL